MRKAVLFVALLVALILTALPGHAATDVNAVGETFVPAVFTAHAGDQVSLHNLEALAIAHTLTSDANLCAGVPCSTGPVASGNTGSFTLPATTAPGEYLFHCAFHIQMRAVLIVN